MMGGDEPEFVEWREEFVSREQGSRVVHYYLEDSAGASHLAVIGTERSLRHMFYAVADEFCEDYGADSCLKWRSRREVIDWLSSLLRRLIRPQDHSKLQKNVLEPAMGADVATNGISRPATYLCKQLDILRGNPRCRNSDITWNGVFWTCNKQLKHYKAFSRNGTMITMHSFVLVMSEGANRYLAYLEDMYEDKKGHKKVKVRWFHCNQEIACVIPPPTHPREVFMTSYFQVISAECVDDLATVLSPIHFEKCLSILPDDSSPVIHVCFRQYDKNRFKAFDISSLIGYYDQTILSCLNICTVPANEEDEIGHGSSIMHSRPKRIRIVNGNQQFLTSTLRNGASGAHRAAYQNMGFDLHVRRPLSRKFTRPWHGLMMPFDVDQKVEMLCQDSGIRGCWFRCTILQLSEKRMKVQYDDVQDEDGCGKLEEWVCAFKPAAPDKLGMRCSGRLTIRPTQPCNPLSDNAALQIGTPVDAWWSDGWWEGVIIGVDNPLDDSLQVYFSGEDVILTCKRKNIRISKDWFRGQWVDIDAKPDVLSAISAVSAGTKLSPCSTLSKGAESGSSVMPGHETTILVRTNKVDEDKKARADQLLENPEQENLGECHRDDDGKGDGEY